MGRSPCCDDTGLKKGPWTSEEDEKLISYIQKHGHGSWRALPKHAGLNRCGKSCRLRWTNYLRPDIKRGKFTAEEEQTILNLHSMLGNKWSKIATHLPGRTDNEIKNFWNTHLKKKLIQMGFDPMTHRPRTDIFASLPHLIALANLKEIMEQNSWENQAVRLQNEAAEMAKLQYLQSLLQPTLSSMMPANNFSLSTNMESCNLLSSLSSVKDNTPFLLDSLTVPSISLNMTDHLPDLDEPCTLINHRDHAAQASDITVNHSQVQASAPPATGTPPVSGTNACSTSSSFEGGPSSSSIWPELLLDDPLFHESA